MPSSGSSPAIPLQIILPLVMDPIALKAVRLHYPPLQLKKENEQQGVGISEREINEIIQGMQISDLEIQLLELQLGGE